MDAAAIERELQLVLTAGATVAETFAPQTAAYIAIGRAVAAATPGLIEDVTKLLSKADPSDEEVKALAGTIASLDAPETL